ncbi:MAG: DUF6544 family protein [Chloroflexota bacterium]
MFELQSFPPYLLSACAVTTIPLPSNLPKPVQRFFTKMFGCQVPVIDSAVVSGKGTIRVKGITLPARWRFVYCAGLGYRHYIEAAVLGHPLLKVNEYYLEGHSRLELPFGVVENEPKVDMAANLGLWGESIWFPSIFLTDTRVHWEAIDDTSARLIIPFGNTTDTFTATFDPQTGLLQQFESLRYREATDTQKTGWRNQVLNWQTFNGMLLPSHAAVRWLDDTRAWFVLNVEEVIYNIDVADYIRIKGI